MVAVKGTTSAYAGDAQPVTPQPAAAARAGRPSPPTPARRRTCAQLAIADAGKTRQVTWRQGTRGRQGQPRRLDDQLLPGDPGPARQPGHPPRRPTAACLSAGCWPNGRPKPTSPPDYWLSNLPEDTPIAELVRLAKIRWRVEHDYRELKTGLGLDHFEGRSFTGWHRHVTLAALAQAFCTLLRSDPKAPAPG